MNNKDEVQQPETVAEGPGKILKRARERANLSCQDIADKMKLRKTLIEEIEQDNFDINISLTFIRGYLKLYAKHVQVNEIEILTAFENLTTQKKEPAKLQSFSRRVAHQANDDKLMLLTYLVVAVVIALVVIWWYQQSSADTTSEADVSEYSEILPQEIIETQALPLEQNPTADDLALVLAPVTIGSPTEDNITTISEAEFAPLTREISSDEPSVDAKIATELSTISQTTPTETRASVELIFEFSGDCWIKLADATGENIAYGVKVKGRVMPVTGIPPFVVTLGAPEVVKISYAGDDVDMSFLPAGRIANFDLPLPE